MGEEDGFSPALTGDAEGAHEQIPPLLPLSQGEATLVTFRSDHYSSVEKGWAWSQPLQGKV